MLRDIERGAPIEAEQILGDLLRRARDDPRSGGQWQGKGSASPLLSVAYAHLKSYEARRAREMGQASSSSRTGGMILPST
jgi:2-dehydropantoate 2-reductase